MSKLCDKNKGVGAEDMERWDKRHLHGSHVLSIYWEILKRPQK